MYAGTGLALGYAGTILPTNFATIAEPVATLPPDPCTANTVCCSGMANMLGGFTTPTETVPPGPYTNVFNVTSGSNSVNGFSFPGGFYDNGLSSYGSDPQLFNINGNSSSLNLSPYFGGLGYPQGLGGFGGVGETNPYFNAGYCGAMDNFYGNQDGGFPLGDLGFPFPQNNAFEDGGTLSGNWTETFGPNGQLQSLTYSVNANPTPEPTPAPNSCATPAPTNSCSTPVASNSCATPTQNNSCSSQNGCAAA